jgi:hypothetical protein
MSKHTPGPWVVRQFPTARGGTIAHWILDAIPDVDGKVVANAIAVASGTNDDAEANAHLMAAAPDLLAACKAFLCAVSPDEFLQATEMIDEAVQKAGGRGE